ncbi:MAG TPA: response regulator [Solidesulfovibrio magneticus]|nr:response regulator [Solidesulfovibrio magneticus]
MLRTWIGIGLTLLAVAVLGAFKANGVAIPNPVLLFALSIVVSSYLGGGLAGLCSVTIALGYVLVDWSMPGELFQYTPANAQRLVVFLVTMPFMALLVCLLHKTSRQRFAALSARTEELEASRSRLQRAELVAMTGNWEVDVATGTLSTSEGARRIYGLGDGEMTLDEAKDRPLPQYRALLDASWTALVERGEPYAVDFQIRRPTDGALVDIHSRATFDPVAGTVFGIIQDVTAAKRVETALIAARRRADEANAAKSRFLATMSHEVRTPLNGLLGMLQVLEAAELTPEDRDCLRAALASARHLGALVSDILDLSRIESGRLETADEPFSLPAVVEETCAPLAELARGKGLDWSLWLDEALPEQVVGDSQKLRRVLNNVIGNAVKFTARGGVRLSCRLVRIRAGRAMVRCLVADDGPGVSEDFLPHLCTVFSQERGQQDGPGLAGVGLGLSIVRELMCLIGGEVTIDSREGEGTDVYLTFEYRLAASCPLPCRDAAAPAPTGLRVLVAEDDAVSRLACRQLLRRLGHVVTDVANGALALAALAEADFDLVVMDLQMPEMDGVTAIGAIRGEARFAAKAGVPIVVMTACAFTEDRDRCLAAGADVYLSKPVEIAALGRAIEAALAAGLARE